jgi:hypothetical protein
MHVFILVYSHDFYAWFELKWMRELMELTILIDYIN